MWLSPSGQVAHTTLDWRLCRTRIFSFRVVSEKPNAFKLKDGTYRNEFYMQKYL